MTQSASYPWRAAAFMAGAMISFSLMAIAGRELSADFDTFEIMFYRSCIGIVIVLSLGGILGTLHEITTQDLRLHGLRNVSHFIGQNLWFYAIVHIPLSQLFAFEFTHPLWVAVLAPLFLGERLGRMRILAFVIGFIGILIVARPESAPITWATAAAAGCALGFAGATIATKILGRTHSTTCILFWLVTMQAVFGAICAGYDGDVAVPDAHGVLWLGIVGCCGLMAHFCITRALKLAPATVVAPLEFLRLPLIAVIGWWLYSEPLVATVFVGAAIVFGANWLNIREESRRSKTA